MEQIIERKTRSKLGRTERERGNSNSLRIKQGEKVIVAGVATIHEGQAIKPIPPKTDTNVEIYCEEVRLW